MEMIGYYIALVTAPLWAAGMAYGVAVLLRYIAWRCADAWCGTEWDYPDDRDDYAREQAIEDGRFEYER